MLCIAIADECENYKLDCYEEIVAVFIIKVRITNKLTTYKKQSVEQGQTAFVNKNLTPSLINF
jgi:hypothetical protein